MKERLLLRPTEAAEQLGICRSRIYEEIRSGRIESVLIGASRRVPWDALVAYIDRLRAGERQIAKAEQRSDDTDLDARRIGPDPDDLLDKIAEALASGPYSLVTPLSKIEAIIRERERRAALRTS
jgi:excisionase family DNA binding protein